MKQNYIKVIGIFFITFFFFALTSSYAEEVTDDFPKNEKRYNIDQMKVRNSLNDLEGKLITSNDGKVVRLVEANHNGKVLVNDGVVPEVVTVYDNIEKATEVTFKAAGQVCTDGNYEKYLKKQGVVTSVVVKGKTYKINIPLVREYGVIVYGKPGNIANNSYKKKEYEFLGFGKNGGWVMNHKYPVQELSENGPDLSRFLLTENFTAAAEDAGELGGIYVGQPNYSNAKKTIEMFKTKWGWKLTDKKAASWWLSESAAKIKMQGIYSEWYAGLGVTQYKTVNGRAWYQTYTVKPDIPDDCEEEYDIAAVKLKGSYKGGNITTDFTIQNMDKSGDSVTTPADVPWSLTWNFKGYDSKGAVKTKSGKISNTKSYFPKTLPYKKNLKTSYSLKNTGIAESWGGTVTLTATWNESCNYKGFEETNCKNNTATTTISLTPKLVEGKICEVPDAEFSERNPYEYDLEVSEVQAYTAKKGEKGQVIATAKRVDFSKDRNKWLAELTAEYNVALKDYYAKEALEEEALDKYFDADDKYNNEPSTIETCTGKGKDQICKTEANPKKAQLAALLNAATIAWEEAECEFFKAGTTEVQLNYEKYMLESNIEQYDTMTPYMDIHYGEVSVLHSQTSLKEGETKIFKNQVTLEEDGTILAEINPFYKETRDYENEFTFENNVKETPIYVSSFEQACAPPGEDVKVEAVVRTTTNDEGTKEDLEVLTGKVANQSKYTIKAGYGFGFENHTDYTNPIATEQVKGVESMESRFETLPNYLEYEVESGLYKVPNEKKSGSTPNLQTATSIWHLPTMYVEEYSGNLFDSNYAFNINRNRNDTILDGGHKWYVDFDETDRTYPFVSYSSETGINHLSVCLMGEVEVKGAILKNEVTDENDNSSEGEAEFVLRTIQPDNAFPGGTGWNWSGKTSVISSLTPWWNTTSTTYPKGITLTPNQVKAIRNYNKTNALKDIKPNNNFSSIVSQ